MIFFILNCIFFTFSMLTATDTEVYAKMNPQKFGIVSFEDVYSIKENDTVYLIDVREPHELKETGSLPNSINIPLNDVKMALLLPPLSFEEKYHRVKPSETTPIIFSCRSGRRSAIASQTAVELGYKKVSNYEGAWLDWEKNIAEINMKRT